jgi:hypothetical protein
LKENFGLVAIQGRIRKKKKGRNEKFAMNLRNNIKKNIPK